MLAKMGEDDVLLVDEAHALGVFGPGGTGAASAYDDPRVVVLGTLSKAFGCAGGFVAGPAEFVELLVSTARSFIFDTSLPPPMVRAARAALRCIVNGDALRERLFDNVAYAAERLGPLGVCSPVRSPIVSVVVGEPQRAVALAAHLRRRGLYAPAIRPPTVPAGTSRLRITLRAGHRREEIDLLAAGIGETLARGVAP
jgi:8-amino-7-oxononanoate synthase